MTALLQDVRYALRGYRRSPAFTAAAILLIALGVGLNAAAFALFDAVVLRPLPEVQDVRGLVEIDEHSASYPTYAFFRDRTRAFSGVAAWANRWLSLSAPGSAERIRGTVVSGNYFEVLGVRPALGRFFASREGESGVPLAVISHRTWRTKLGGSPSAVGASIRLNGIPFTVIGIAPAAFRGVGFATPPDVWLPVGAWPRVATGELARLDYRNRSWGWLSMFGRLRSGVDLDLARAEAKIVVRLEATAFPADIDAGNSPALQPLARAAAGSGEASDPVRLFGTLLGAVGVVLLIACANLANLLLARAAGRRQEVAVRLALGASRGRLVRQLLTESLVLSLGGGLAGLLVAAWSLAIASGVSLPGGSTLGRFGASLDGRVLGFAFGISLAAGLLFGMVPALLSSRATLVPALKRETARASRRPAMRKILVTAQLALSLVLLSSAFLLVRSLRNALGTDVGFESHRVALASVHLGIARYDAPRALRWSRALADRAAALPGVRAVAWAGTLPLSGYRDTETVDLEGFHAGAVDAQSVGPGYYAAIGTPMAAGREFDRVLDPPGAAPAVIVNEAAARRFWPGADPIGKRLTIQGATGTVVGVARDARFRSLTEPPVPMVTANLDQLGGSGLLSTLTLLVRTSAEPRSVLEPLRGEIARLDPDLPVFGLQTLDDSIADMLLPQRLGSALIGLFAALALVLAEVGVYGVVAAHASGRFREMGIRMALGARPGQVRRMVVRDAAFPIVLGVAAGLPLAAIGARLLERFLYGVTPSDPATFGACVLLLAGGALAAADFPARRAGRIAPLEALRHE
ncbi:MAG: ADOP family duplicated permease [Acidobacteriota bacterium]